MREIRDEEFIIPEEHTPGMRRTMIDDANAGFIAPNDPASLLLCVGVAGVCVLALGFLIFLTVVPLLRF